MKKTVVQYNAVIDRDLFYTIYDWMRTHTDALAKDYGVVTMNDFDKLSLEDWKDLAEDAIMWLEHYELPKVEYICDGESPSLDTWGTLYYQTLAYMSIKHAWEPTYRNRTFDEQIVLCKECIEYLKEKIDEIREPTDDDLLIF